MPRQRHQTEMLKTDIHEEEESEGTENLAKSTFDSTKGINLRYKRRLNQINIQILRLHLELSAHLHSIL